MATLGRNILHQNLLHRAVSICITNKYSAYDPLNWFYDQLMSHNGQFKKMFLTPKLTYMYTFELKGLSLWCYIWNATACTEDLSLAAQNRKLTRNLTI